jgi:hypothetical protein
VATGLGDATLTISGGGLTCKYAPEGTGAMQSSFFVPASGHAKSPPTPAPVPLPMGLLDFVLVDCDPGATVHFDLVYPAALAPGAQYWKYGPTAAEPSPHWYVLPATVSGNAASFDITDGGLGDDDLAANGIVRDQGGPGGGPGAAAPVPTLGEWAAAVLASLLLATGLAAHRRRRGAARDSL